MLFTNKSSVPAFLIAVTYLQRPSETFIDVVREGESLLDGDGIHGEIQLLSDVRVLMPGEWIRYVVNVRSLVGSELLQPGRYGVSVDYDSTRAAQKEPRIRPQQMTVGPLAFEVLPPGQGGLTTPENQRGVEFASTKGGSPAAVQESQSGFFELEIVTEEENRFPYGDDPRIRVAVSNNTQRPLCYLAMGEYNTPARFEVELSNEGKIVPPITVVDAKPVSTKVWPLLPGERLLVYPLINERTPPLPPGHYAIKVRMIQRSSDFGLAKGQTEAEAEFSVVPSKDMPAEVPEAGPFIPDPAMGLVNHIDEVSRNFEVCKGIPESWGYGTGAPEAPSAEEEARKGPGLPWWVLVLAASATGLAGILVVVLRRWRQRSAR